MQRVNSAAKIWKQSGMNKQKKRAPRGTLFNYIDLTIIW